MQGSAGERGRIPLGQFQRRNLEASDGSTVVGRLGWADAEKGGGFFTFRTR